MTITFHSATNLGIDSGQSNLRGERQIARAHPAGGGRTPQRAPWRAPCAIALLFSSAIASSAEEADRSQLRLSDRLRLVPTAGAALYSAYRGDTAGLWQLGGELGATLIATEALKQAFNDTSWGERPDHEEKSFPSGHTSTACAGAAYLGERYGWAHAAPAYAVSAYVAYIRVHENRHHVRDVVAGCALAYGLSRLIVQPFETRAEISLQPLLGPEGAGLALTVRW